LQGHRVRNWSEAVAGREVLYGRLPAEDIRKPPAKRTVRLTGSGHPLSLCEGAGYGPDGFTCPWYLQARQRGRHGAGRYACDGQRPCDGLQRSPGAAFQAVCGGDIQNMKLGKHLVFDGRIKRKVRHLVTRRSEPTEVLSALCGLPIMLRGF
jgi:hypothetical protein